MLAGRLASDKRASDEAHGLFSTWVPEEWLAQGLPETLSRQVLPDAAETLIAPGYGSDPVGDLAAMTVPGLIHKYAHRALLVVTGACPIHCRYCFRRHFPYAGATSGGERWEAALAYLRAHPEVTEVLLSGGDPLMVPTARLRELSRELVRLPELRRLRIHTRMPVVVPSRVDDELLAWLEALERPTTVVLHVNHARELTARARSALGRLRATGVTLLNQSVLLAGVNDDADSLVDLAESLFDAGVLPYYLHLLDPVAGAAHFAVSDDRGEVLMARLRARLPGYLVPRLVREIAGDAAKRPIA